MKDNVIKAIVWVLAALTLVSLLVAVYVAVQRIQWENDYRQVSVAATAPTYLRWQAANQAADLAPVNSVVFDAAALAPLQSLRLKPLAAFESFDEFFDDEHLNAVNDRGLDVVLALPSLSLVDEARLELLRTVMADYDVKGVVLVETQTGWTHENLRKILTLLQAQEVWASTLEFHQPEDLLALYREGHTQWVRAHIIPHRERIALGEADALARYERAVRERNFRLLILNEKNEAYPISESVEALTARLAQAGYRLGAVPQPASWALPGWTLWVLSLALWTTTLWLFQRLWKRFPWVLGALGVLAALIVLWQWAREDSGLRFLSLSMAIITPMCVYRGMMLLQPFQGLGYGLRVFALGTLATVGGGLIQAAFMSEPAYFLKLGQFESIKLALFEPILVIAYWEMKRRGKGVWKSLWQRPLTWGEAMAGVAIVGGLIFVLLRSGNDSLLPLLPYEQDLRGFLESWLYARPRFKEFMLGHPLLIVWLAWGIWRWKLSGAVVALIGFLGQTTILNSFAHLHTPLTLTLLRTLNGLVLGMIVGIALWELTKWFRKRQQQPPPTASS